MHTALLVFLGGRLAALAEGLADIGAHTLKTQLTPEQLETLHSIPCPPMAVRERESGTLLGGGRYDAPIRAEARRNSTVL